MEKQKNIRNKWLNVRLDEAEHQQLQRQFGKTTETDLSKYVRKIILGQPMIGRVKNESLQEIVVILNGLRKDLNGVGNNYNQMLQKLHLSDTGKELKAWIMLYEAQREKLFDDIRTIKEYIQKTSEKWLQ